MLPQTNARLLQIAATGGMADWDKDETAGTPKWTGDVDAYVEDKLRTNFVSEGGMAKTHDTQIVLSADLLDVNGGPLPISTGDILVYSFRGQMHSRHIMDVSGAAVPDGMFIPEYVRYYLRPEPAEYSLESS